MITECDVAIIGAGLAGLTAARTLVAEGKNVLVLEAQKRVGGRTLGHTLEDGSVLELGGQWLGPTQAKMYALCKELGLETYPTYTSGDGIVSLNGSMMRLKSGDSSLSALSSEVALEVRTLLDELEAMSQSLDLESPWNHPLAKVWDNETCADWLEHHTLRPETEAYLRLELRGIFAAELTELSLLHVLFTLKAGGGFCNLVSVQNGAQQDRIRGGSQLVAERMAEMLGKRIILSTPVSRLEQHDMHVNVIADSLTVKAERVIVALPPKLAERLVYEPALPQERQHLLQRSSMGSVIKVMVVYEKPFWRDEGLNGQVLCDTAPIHSVYDNSPEDGSLGVLLGFVEGENARHLRCLGHAARERLTLEALAGFFGEKALNYKGYLEKNWLTDPWVLGGYCGHFSPNVWTNYGGALREPCGKIHWAGTETSGVWNGYMEGAVLSGERAAKEILALQRSDAVTIPIREYAVQQTVLV
jgi:monoamine oxidase